MHSVVAVPLTVFRIAACPDVRVVVANAGLACCSMEVEAAIRTGLLLAETGNADPAAQTVLLVSGTVTDALATAILQMHAGLSAPVRVVAFGACASTGGPYWDAPTVTKGIDQLVEVSAYIPGCPPSPDALIAGLLAMTRRDFA